MPEGSRMPPGPPRLLGVVLTLAWLVIMGLVVVEEEFEPPPPPPPPEEADAVVLGLTMVVTPAGLVFRRTFLVLGNLLSFLYFIRRFWNHILI